MRDRYLIATITLVVILIVGTVLLLLPRKYTAESSFILQSRATLPANLSGLASQFGLALGTGEANESPAFYAELLQSREILSTVVDSPIALHRDGELREAALSEWFDVDGATPALTRDKTIRKLKKAVKVSPSVRTGIVTLRVVSNDAELSTRISERMLSWLNEFNLRKRQSHASAERQFTEARMEEARLQLRGAEERLLLFTQRNRDTRNSPLLKLEEDRLSREVLMRQQVYTSVVQAHDRAKIEEVRDTPVITVLQPPEIPARADPRGIAAKMVLTLIGTLVLGIWLAMGRQALRPKSDISPQAEFGVLVAEVRSDLRHPIRTLGRWMRFSGSTRREREGGPPRA